MSLVLIKPTIQELKDLIGDKRSYDNHRSVFSIYPDGFSLGSIIEICGSGKTKAIAQFLSENSQYQVAWVEEDISINPYALFQMGVNIKNILFIEAKKEINWCLNQILQSGCFKVVIAQSKKISEKDLRRYQLGSEKNQSHFFLLSETPHSSWVPQLQLKALKHKSSISLNVIRKRGVG
jgi:hypothetical protein